MSKIKSKGCSLQQYVGAAYVTVAQVISITLPEAESKTYEADTLDNSGAGIPHEPTGQTEGGSASAELFFDPALAGHQSITDILTTPAACNWKIIFSDSSSWTFAGAGLKFGGSIALNEGVKAKLEVKLNGIVSYPT